jgi:hypothetical protein
MNRLLLLLVTVFSVGGKSIAQCDTTLPISVTIGIEKEYSLKFPRDHFFPENFKGEYYIRTDSAKEDRYDIEVILKNNSTRPIFIWLMTCSWQDNFQINNDYTFWSEIWCSKNIPELVQFSPGLSKTYRTTLSKSVKFENPCENCVYGPQVETTKLGLIIIDDVYKPKLTAFMGYDLAMRDKSVWKIVWSNSLFLLNKTELSFTGAGWSSEASILRAVDP